MVRIKVIDKKKKILPGKTINKSPKQRQAAINKRTREKSERLKATKERAGKLFPEEGKRQAEQKQIQQEQVEFTREDTARQLRAKESRDLSAKFNIERNAEQTEKERQAAMGVEPTPEPSFLERQQEKGEIKREEQLQTLRDRLAQPETGKVLDKIERWRVETKLENLENRDMLIGVVPISAGASVAAGGNQWAGVQAAVDNMLRKAGTKTATGQLGILGGSGMQGVASNSKNIALTGSWLSKAGFTVKAAAVLGSIITLTAWAKHNKAEAIEFIPYQIQLAQEAGDEEGAAELSNLLNEIADPQGWANIIEEVPGLNVIKASLDKARVSQVITKLQDERFEKQKT